MNALKQLSDLRALVITSKLADPQPTKQTVYLDQWVWIELAQVHFGRSERWRVAYDAVEKSAAAGTASFPMSLSHLKEVAKRCDEASRARLVDFMTTLWNADAIRPWSQMLEPEAENAVKIMMGATPVDLTNFVFGKGIGHVVGGVPTLVPKDENAAPIPPATLRKLADLIVSPNLLAVVKNPEFSAVVRIATQREEEFMSNQQGVIDAEYAHPDKTKRDDIAEARFMANVVGPALVRAMMRATPDPKGLISSCMSSREQIGAVRKNMPTFHTFHALTHARNKTRRVKGNDLWDLALNIAIPYCDVVVTERGWCNIANRAGLNDLYGTKIVHTPSQLAALLSPHPSP